MHALIVAALLAAAAVAIAMAGKPTQSLWKETPHAGVLPAGKEGGRPLRTISILLIRTGDPFSWLIYYLTGRGFTHVSLALEEAGPYYSFNFKGFCRETLEKHRRRGVKGSMELRLQVPDWAYRALCRKVGEVARQADQYHYSGIGVFCAILRVPFRWRRHYFCSQFVAEVLTEAGAVPLAEPPCLCLPNHFPRAVMASPALVGVRQDFL